MAWCRPWAICTPATWSWSPRARAENDIVVVSIFVNPLQFGANEDLAKYPRDLERDSAMLRDAKVDFLFAPGVADMYPRPMATLVDVPKLGMELEGAVRPGHFAASPRSSPSFSTSSSPSSAYFGEKDYQQVAIIRRMVDDLAQPVRVVPVPTVRDADGLALSSRNVYLSKEERAAAVIVPQALAEAERLYREGADDPAAFEAALRAFIASEPLATPEVAAVRNPDTLEPLTRLQASPFSSPSSSASAPPDCWTTASLVSSRPPATRPPEMSTIGQTKRITPAQIEAMKGTRPIVSLTAYTTPIARLLDPHCDLLLVGDSSAWFYTAWNRRSG